MQVRGTGWVKLWCPKRPAADHSKHRKQNATPSGVGRRSQEKTAIAIVTKIPAMVWLVSHTIPIDRSLIGGGAYDRKASPLPLQGSLSHLRQNHYHSNHASRLPRVH